MPVFDAGSPSVKKAASPSETGWKEERPARRPWEKEREGKRRDGSGVERERPASEHEGGRQPGDLKGRGATRKVEGCDLDETHDRDLGSVRGRRLLQRSAS